MVAIDWAQVLAREAPIASHLEPRLPPAFRVPREGKPSTVPVIPLSISIAGFAYLAMGCLVYQYSTKKRNLPKWSLRWCLRAGFDVAFWPPIATFLVVRWSVRKMRVKIPQMREERREKRAREAERKAAANAAAQGNGTGNGESNGAAESAQASGGDQAENDARAGNAAPGENNDSAEHGGQPEPGQTDGTTEQPQQSQSADGGSHTRPEQPPIRIQVTEREHHADRARRPEQTLSIACASSEHRLTLTDEHDQSARPTSGQTTAEGSQTNGVHPAEEEQQVEPGSLRQSTELSNQIQDAGACQQEAERSNTQQQDP